MKEEIYNILCSNRHAWEGNLAASKYYGHMMCKKFERSDGPIPCRASSFIAIIRAMDILLHQAEVLFRAHFIQSNDYFLCTHLSFFLLPTALSLLDWQKMIATQPTTRWLTTRWWYYSKCCSAAQLSSNLSTEVVTYYDDHQWYTIDRAEHEIFDLFEICRPRYGCVYCLRRNCLHEEMDVLYLPSQK